MDLETTYLKRIRKSNYNPNFYCSKEFWKNMGWKAVRKGNVIYIVDKVHNSISLPALDPKGHVDFSYPFFYSLIGMEWDLIDGGVKEKRSSFLDYNYIYDGEKTAKAEGSLYKTFRKNRKKWPTRNPGFTVIRGPFLDYRKRDTIRALVIKWLEKKEGLIHCADNLLFLLERTNMNNSFLIENSYGKAVSWNVWDYNFAFVNYRWCIVDPDEPFLDEFSRFVFHSMPRSKNRLINDGGELWDEKGKPNGLAVFKRRLNPVEIRPIFSYGLQQITGENENVME